MQILKFEILKVFGAYYGNSQDTDDQRFSKI